MACRVLSGSFPTCGVSYVRIVLMNCLLKALAMFFGVNVCDVFECYDVVLLCWSFVC